MPLCIHLQSVPAHICVAEASHHSEELPLLHRVRPAPVQGALPRTTLCPFEFSHDSYVSNRPEEKTTSQEAHVGCGHNRRIVT